MKILFISLFALFIISCSTQKDYARLIHNNERVKEDMSLRKINNLNKKNIRILKRIIKKETNPAVKEYLTSVLELSEYYKDYYKQIR